ncbi:MAG: hypothetical protein WBB36_14195 [Chitinophagales bacterium]
MYQKELFEAYPNYQHERFLLTDVGQLYQAIPFDALVKLVPAPKRQISGKGCKPWFDVKGGIGLQFLKCYLRLSDAQLIERINTDWSLQYFCNIQLTKDEIIADNNLPSVWRMYIGRHLDIDKWQPALIKSWKPYMKETFVSTQDATCYESYIAYPTHVKLIWKGCNEVHVLIQELSKKAKLRKSRNNYDKWKSIYLSYQKGRKKPRKKEKKIRKALLKYLRRLLDLFASLRNKHPCSISKTKQQRLATIQTLYDQQHALAYGHVERIEKCIVSIDKPYLRPIVRGKEIKPVEFGAKVNKLQVDGISMIEHLDFEAFHEGNRLEKGIHLHEELFGKCTHHGADGIYATNANRTYLKNKGITHNFCPKGKQKAAHVEQNKIMRSVLNKERSTRLEGSFGNEKNHFQLTKVKARTLATEICWIFFGIQTANAKQIGDRIAQIKREQQIPPDSPQLKMIA